MIGTYCKIFGINPRNRIIEFFLEGLGLDFSIGDIAKETGLNRATTYNTIKKLLKEKIIMPTRKVSGSQLYGFSPENMDTYIMIQAFDLILLQIVREKK